MAFIKIPTYLVLMWLADLMNAVNHTLFSGTFRASGPSFIYKFSFDDDSNKLSLISKTPTSEGATIVTLGHDKSTLLTASNRLWTSLDVDATTTEPGVSKEISITGPCAEINNTRAIALTTSQNTVYGSLFSGGTNTFADVSNCGNVLATTSTGELDRVIQTFAYEPDSGVNSLAADRAGDFLYSADDKGTSIYTHKISKVDGSLSQVGRMKVSGGMQPRGVLVHPGGKKLYVTMEGGNVLAVYDIDAETHLPCRAAIHDILPDAFEAQVNTYNVQPPSLSRDATTLFISLRSFNQSIPGFIVAFGIDKSGTVENLLSRRTTSGSGGFGNIVTPSRYSDTVFVITSGGDGVEGSIVMMQLQRHGLVILASLDLGVEQDCCSGAVWYD